MEDVDDMMREAEAARANAYAPYSRFKVGACIRTASGNLYNGCNVENAAFPEGTCAEAGAIAAMVAAGEREIVAIAICGGPADGPAKRCLPCGGCRQKLFEFAPPDGDLAIFPEPGDDRAVMLSTLLPQPFGPEDLAGPND